MDGLADGAATSPRAPMSAATSPRAPMSAATSPRLDAAAGAPAPIQVDSSDDSADKERMKRFKSPLGRYFPYRRHRQLMHGHE